MNTPYPVIAAVQFALDAALILNPEARPPLSVLDGRVVQFTLQELNWNLYFTSQGGALRVAESWPTPPEVIFQGSPTALARLALEEDGDNVLRQEVTLEGDVELAGQFRQWLAMLAVDWEELLAQAVGDIPAHWLGSHYRETSRYAGQVYTSLTASSSEYLQEELRLLPTRHEVTHWLADVDTLQEDVARLVARLQLLLS